MAKTSGPLLSLEAHGSLSNILTYSRKRTGSQVRKYNKPTVPATAKQRGQHRLTEFLVAQWQNMSAADKATWAANARTSGLNLSGYHYFLREAQKDLYTHHGLCGYWHCNEIVGGKVLDLSGKGNHGTLKPTYPSDAPRLANSYNTKFSKALKYDGSNDYVTCGDSTSLRITSEITIEAVIKGVYDVADLNAIVAKWAGTKRNYYLSVYEKRLRALVVESAASKLVYSDTVLTDNIWYIVAFSVKSGDMNIYIGGQLDKHDTPTYSAIDVSDEPLIIGARSSGGDKRFEGIIDEACLYNRALSAAEIATRYKFAIAKV